MLCGSSSYLLVKILNQIFPAGLVTGGGFFAGFVITVAAVT